MTKRARSKHHVFLRRKLQGCLKPVPTLCAQLNFPANSLQKNTVQHHMSLHTLLNTEDPKVQKRSPWLPYVVLGIRALKIRWGLRDGCANDRVALQVDEIVSTYVSLAKNKQKKQSLRWDIDGYKRLPQLPHPLLFQTPTLYKRVTKRWIVKDTWCGAACFAKEMTRGCLNCTKSDNNGSDKRRRRASDKAKKEESEPI
jgi:hypothetical protein